MKILLIDNYDSFTFNLYHYISSLGIRVDVVRNDKITANDIKKNKFYVQAGAGIVADSKPIKEYEETINKAKALINALK